MATDDEVQGRIVRAASELFTEHGYGATSLAMVARRAGVSSRAIHREMGGKREVLSAVLASRGPSEAASLVAAAAEAPRDAPPLSALIQAAHTLFAAPERTWDPLDLEVLARARQDTELRDVAEDRVATRFENARALAEATREAGGLAPGVSADAVAHLSMVLSIGLAMLDPVATRRPAAAEWGAMIARIGAALAPEDLLLEAGYDPTTRWRVRVDVPGRPGAIALMVRALAALHAYTMYLQVVGQAAGTSTIDIGLIAPRRVSPEAIRAAAESAGSRVHLTSGYEDTGEDLLTRTVDAATRVVKQPSAAPRVAAALVAADDVEVIDATGGSDDRADVLRLQWTADRHVLLHRRWAPFARTEQARASAVLRLSAAVARLRGDDAVGWIEAVRDGTVWIRLARPEDSAAVAAMHGRCSPRSRYQRYFALPDWQEIQLRRLSGGHRGASLVAMSRDGLIVGLGNVFPEAPAADAAEHGRPDAARTAEIALLVEDDYQGAGIGSVLLQRMLQVATQMGFTHVVAYVLAENSGMIRLLDRTGLTWRTSVSDGVASMTAPLATSPKSRR